jgi:tetratricopeptide (TPR) repeat protein
MDPNFVSAHLWLAQVYEQKGMFEEAITELQEGLRLSGDSPFALAKLGQGYALAGRREDAHSVLDQLKVLWAQRYVSPYDVAMIYLGLQENDEAFAWMQKAFDQRSLWLGYIGVEPQLDAVRGDQRFAELLHQLGLQN